MTRPDLFSAFPQVTVFHETYLQAIRTEPTWDIPERQLRVELINKKAKEYAEAPNLMEVFDALGDLVYVAIGAALAHGVTEQVKDALERPRGAILSISESAFAYNEAVASKDLGLVAESIATIIRSCYVEALRRNVNLSLVLDEIQRSNLSKLDENGKPIFREDGKVLNGPNFFAPDISGMLEARNIR